MLLTFADRIVRYGDQVLLDRIGELITPLEDPLGHGLFLAACGTQTNSRHVFRLGSIPRLRRFTLCHRYEPYWMKPRAGTRHEEVPPETQSLVAELDGGHFLLLVPLIGDPFRFSLRGGKDDSLELLAESGDAHAAGFGGVALFVAAGPNPFTLMRRGALSVAARLESGLLRRDKPVPDFTDSFGWCTWDAFYEEVSADKVRLGLESFARGGIAPRYIILDDGWQSTARMPTGERRLTAFGANEKFPEGLGPVARMAKQEFGVEFFLVWHAIVGYWGGIDHERLPGYGVVDQSRQFGEGVMFHVPNFNQDWWGNLVGFVPAEHIQRFFNDYHDALAAEGVDGVKVDSQAVLEALAEKQGGRVTVHRAYRRALEASVQHHFGGRLINCMSNGQETWYGSRGSTLLRSSIDFLPARPESHGMHLYANAQVGLWFGEFMQPDWDMFQSGHPWGAYHAAGRAISGGPVYVSDKPNGHDFALLSKLVCSDGSVLRCDGPGLPTLDTLCHDPTREPLLLKIWNRNGEAGIVGVFHAQFDADEAGKRLPLAGSVGPSDIPDWEGTQFACYAHRARSLVTLARSERIAVTLAQGDFELFTMVPIRHGFAPIGLTDKFNSAGAVSRLARAEPNRCDIALRDGGEFSAFCERAPTRAESAGEEAPWIFDGERRALRVTLRSRGRQTLSLFWQ